ncbi:MAG: aldo/keto reductase [Clostridiaceae bacterium BRH_c20a]|nr:MAG: aldo/keto reductase [Clostridiaceae bacterium BRH_c20a]
MKYVKLGKTGIEISEVGFGCIPIIRLSNQDAADVMKYALDRGINFYDTANLYRDSEEKIGMAFKGSRDKVVLATKTFKRDVVGAAQHIENSLRMLQTDYIDLFQFHQISKEEEWETILGPGGAMETVIRAKEEGKIRSIGFSSHSHSMSIKLIKTNLFESLMFPFSFIEDSAVGEMLNLIREHEMSFLAMKPFGGGVIDDAQLTFKFLRQYQEAVPVPGFDTMEQIDEILNIYEKPNIVTPEDLILMEKYKQELGSKFCRRCEYCQPCPSGVLITSAMTYPVVSKRMSPTVAVEFAKSAMDSIANCTDCGACIEKCPYQLPIPQILQENYKMYEEHRQVQGDR